ncbi:DNA replication complex GINS protein PSF3 [Cylas formicarius]|uniref:DNA replication complex GINS protein PSF3 n=1 Tax=Cylas formicarius TaxID=197179 RepID=UPI0029589F87|nr:DNA replication complex GINS protein PSF3 [Cylas formicarius]
MNVVFIMVKYSSNMLTSYHPDYYSIDDILATQERVLCKFIQQVPRMGKLNPSVEEKNLAIGTELELPLWLALDISATRQPVVIPELPKIFKEAYREILKADASAVDLHKFNLYFYELGSYIKHMDRREEVHNILLHTFITRFRLILDLAHNSKSDPIVQQRLDSLERKLFLCGYNSQVKLNSWLVQSNAPIEAATMVTTHRKRKRVYIDIFN